jgi:hypothetical protein
MRRLPRLAVSAVVVAAVLGGVPASAVDELPAYCGTNPKFLATLPEGATLVEKTLYFHGATPSGDVGVRANVDDTFMDATPPTAAAPKEKLNLGGAANAASNKNSLVTYWVGKLAAPERIVCAQVDFTAASTEAFSTSLWLDQPRGADGAAVATGTAAALTEEQINPYRGTFGRNLNNLVTGEIVVQVLAATAAPVLYDAVGTAGSLTYLTVEIPEG